MRHSLLILNEANTRKLRLMYLELSLKVYLLATGVGLNKLRYKYGNDINKLLEKSVEKEINKIFPLLTEHYGAIDLLNEEYNKKDIPSAIHY